MCRWTSKLFVFKDQGQDYVSTALPMGVIDASRVRVYEASGPYMPVGFPKPELVGDATAWMAALTGKGFKFEASEVG